MRQKALGVIKLLWPISYILYIAIVIVMVVSKSEEYMILAVIATLICMLEELLLHKPVHEDMSRGNLITNPYIALLIVPLCIVLGYASNYNFVNQSFLVVLSLMAAVPLCGVRLIRFHREIFKPFDIGTLLFIIVVFCFYWLTILSSLSAVNCSLDRTVPIQTEASVITKGYMPDATRGLSFKKRLVIVVDSSEYDELYIDVTEDEYTHINKSDIVDLNYGRGLLGAKYVYYGTHKWSYPLIKSSLTNKEFREFIKHEEMIGD